MINTTSEKGSNKSVQSLKFKDQFNKDFANAINRYSDKYLAKADFEELTGLSSRTFERYESGQTSPLESKTIEVYKFILNKKKLYLEELPTHARDYVKTKITNPSNQGIDLTNLFRKHDIYKEIFLKTRRSRELFLTDLSLNYGSLIIDEAITTLESMNVIKRKRDGVYTKGKVSSFFTPNELKTLSAYMSDSLSPEICSDDDTRVANMLDTRTYRFSDDSRKIIGQKANEFIALCESLNDEKANNFTMLSLCLNTDIIKEGGLQW